MMKKVLLVDERSELTSDSLAENLRDHGYDVATCKPSGYPVGTEGFDPDRIFYIPLALEMGPTLLPRLRENYPHVKIVIYATPPFLKKYGDEIRGLQAEPLEMIKTTAEKAAALG